MVRRLPLLLAAWLLPLLAWGATQVEATLSRNPVPAGEAVTLEVVVNDDLPANALDSSALGKDFIVGNTSVSRSTQITNLNVSRVTRWQINLIATNPGNYTIPPLKVDGLMTAPIKLQVVKAGSSIDAQDVLLETELSDNQAYPGEQITYSVKLLVASDLKSGQLSDPSVDNADIKRLGEDKEGNETRQGRRYHTYSRQYAVFPKEVGNYVISPPVFNGETFTQDRRGFYQTKEVGKVGQPQSLIVKAIPDNSKPWLPARDLSLEERWSADPKDWKVGQPLTRTLVLTATGTQASNLPPLTLPVPDGLKEYPDQKDRKDFIKDGWLTAQQTVAEALVPTRAGKLELPEVDITWFDTLAGKYRVATLPARTLTIAAVAPQPSEVVQQQAPPSETHAGFWPYLAMLALLAWLLTLVLWFRQRQGRPGKKGDASEASEAPGWLRLRQAVHGKDANLAGQALLAWAREKYQVHSLEELAGLLRHPPLTDAITALQQQRFAPQGTAWDGHALWQALSDAKLPEPPPPGSGLYARFQL
ncbi:BatD family protein [Gallaecimonas pentaromativorans]|uniref:BatD family protein n=1 Tax=Gallaecimonas pentaromativorans TaxID=584787 RepID=UPI00067F37F1|nr:BatD family protein [Gallaecimonas pentaromativorans]